MRIKYINQQQAVAALRLAAYGIEETMLDDITCVKYWQRKTKRIDEFCNDMAAAYAKLNAPAF